MEGFNFLLSAHLVRVIGTESEALVSKAPSQISVAVSRHKNLKIHVNAVFYN